MKFFLIILIFVSFAIADEILNDEKDNNNIEMARVKKFKHYYGLWHIWGFHGLAILFWLKVKIIIVSFIIGTAIVWAARVIWAQKSCPETYHGGPIISYDHGFHDHMDHIPFSSYSDVYPGHEPYGGYSSLHSDIIDNVKSHPQRKDWKGRQFSFTEDQISDMVFLFLGVKSESCKKRFLCELEFKSQRHPLTRMAFRIFGQGFFLKYIRNSNDENSPKSFEECETVHHECKVIEEYMQDEEVENTTKNENKNEKQILFTKSINTPERKLKSRRKILNSRVN